MDHTLSKKAVKSHVGLTIESNQSLPCISVNREICVDEKWRACGHEGFRAGQGLLDWAQQHKKEIQEACSLRQHIH